MPCSQSARRQGGAALVLVVLVIGALALIGAPFVISMRLQERSANHGLARQQAHLAATSARNHAVARLFDTCAGLESGTDGEVDIDLPAEIDVSIPGLALRTPIERISCDVHLEDEQGKVHLNTAPPPMLGHLLGASLLDRAISAKPRLDRIPVEDPSRFSTDDDPRSVDGVVVILDPESQEAEAFTYRGRTRTHLTGCVRGEYLSIPRAHRAGSPVLDVRAYKLFLHRSRHERPLFRTIQSAREIAESSIVHHFLWRRGFDPETPLPARIEAVVAGMGAGPPFRAPLSGSASRRIPPRALRSLAWLAPIPGLETLLAEDLHRIEDLLTTRASRPSNWTREKIVLGPIPARVTPQGFPLTIAGGDLPSPGTVVCIRSREIDGPGETRLVVARPPSAPPIEGTVIWLDAPLPPGFRGGETTIASQVRHALNINTASRTAITAALFGLSQDSRGRHRVTSREALALTNRIDEARPVRGFDHLRELVEAAARHGDLDLEDVAPILTNATNPLHPSLAVSSVGFVYATGDVYTIDASAVVRSASGSELATSRYREIVEVAPSETLEFTCDSQEEWASRFFPRGAPSAAAWARASYPRPGRDHQFMVTLPDPLHLGPFAPPSREPGQLLALPRRLPRLPITWHLEHFDRTIEGADLTGQTFSISTASPSPGEGDLVTRPGMVEMWIRPRWRDRGRDRMLFDSAADPATPDRHRIRLFLDGDRSELVFQIFDDTPVPASRRSRTDVAPAEIRHALDHRRFADHRWYHVAAVWCSTFPGHQALLIDHRPVGQNQWLGRVRRSLSASGRRLEIEPPEITRHWPAQGTLLIGDEAAEYVKRGRSIALRQRGVRGTRSRRHPADTPVRVLGYAVEMVRAVPLFALRPVGEAPVAARAHDLILGPGGARVTRPLEVPRALQDIPASGFSRPSGSPAADVASFPAVRGEATPGGLATELRVEQDPEGFGFPDSGFIEVTNLIGREIMKYQRIRHAGDHWKIQGLTRALWRTSRLSVPGMEDPGIIVRSISIAANRRLEERYAPSGVVRLGGVRSEWIRYDGIVDGRYLVASPRSPLGFRGFSGMRTVAGERILGPVGAHGPGTEIFPVVRIATPRAGAGDRVQITETLGAPAQRRREPRTMTVAEVRRSHHGTYVTFREQARRAHRQAFAPRIKRTPAGELPERSSGLARLGGSTVPTERFASLDATVDEVRLSELGEATGLAAVPVTARGQVPFEPAGRGPAVRIRNGYAAETEVTPRGLDRILLIGSGGFTRGLNPPRPDRFGGGHEEGLITLHGETFHYRLDSTPTPSGTTATLFTALRGDHPRGVPIDSVPFTGGGNFPPFGGFLEVMTDEVTEILYYHRREGSRLRGVLRGQLGTSICTHGGSSFPFGASASVLVRSLPTRALDLRSRSLLGNERRSGVVLGGDLTPLPHLAVTELTAPMTGTTIPARSVNRFPPSGYVITDDGRPETRDEILFHEERIAGGLVLARDERTGQAILRGRFGTDAASPGTIGASVIELPTRFGDRYQERTDDPALAFWERSARVPGAHWDDLSWQLAESSAPGLEGHLRVIVRFDGSPAWDAEVTQRPGGLYAFTDGEDVNTLDVQADQIEIRVYPCYPRGSHGGDADAWNQTPILERLRLSYRKMWRVVHREELDY